METIWRRAQPILRERVGERNYRTWIETIRDQFANDCLLLEVPNQFSLEWVTRNFLAAIRDVVALVAERPVEVKLAIATEVALEERTAADAPGRGAREESGSEVDEGAVRTPKGPLRAGEVPRGRKPAIGRLVEQYTFNSFVVGDSNEIAHDAALEVSHHPGRRFNPLFIHGGVGLGKTHLINALGHEFMGRFPRRRVACLAAETFMNQLINSLRQDQMNAFRERYRQLDLLVLDDVQFIAGKERTQEEFFHTFNALQQEGKQIVLTSDKSPTQIDGLEHRLRSRFEGGLIADIHPPTLGMRVSIAQRKAAGMGFDLEPDVAEFIAARSGTSVRELEGALTRLVAFAKLHGNQISLATAKEALAALPVRAMSLTFDEVLRCVSNEFSVANEALVGHGLTRQHTLPRQLAMYLCRTVAGGSFPAIAEKFGGRDHSTVMHAVKAVEGKREADPATASLISRLESSLRGGLSAETPTSSRAKRTQA